MCLDKFFNPQAVAIIGATENPQNITSTIIKNLFEMDFKGSIHAKFILGGNIHANKDIMVDSKVVNSTVKTLETIIIPKGRTGENVLQISSTEAKFPYYNGITKLFSRFFINPPCKIHV